MGLITRRQALWSLSATLGIAATTRSGEKTISSAIQVRDRTAWKWAVDYGPATDPALARTYQLLVLEPDHPRPIEPLRGPGSLLLGYISLGEVERTRPSFALMAGAGALMKPNPHWPDARMADLRHEAWADHVVEELIPRILAIGYDGLFLDTLDNAEALEREDPRAHAGIVAAGVALLKRMRERFPQAVVMMNRGYALLPGAAASIDALLGESMASRWSFSDKRYEKLSDADWQWQADRLRAARAANPALELMTLDYWDPADPATVAALYARERAAGFLPYVSTLELNRLIPEPRA